ESCCWHQPGGLEDSSRWLKQSENHRNKSKKELHPEGVRESQTESLQVFLIWHPTGVRSSSCINRWSSLLYDHRLLSDNPRGWGRLQHVAVTCRLHGPSCSI